MNPLNSCNPLGCWAGKYLFCLLSIHRENIIHGNFIEYTIQPPFAIKFGLIYLIPSNPQPCRVDLYLLLSWGSYQELSFDIRYSFPETCVVTNCGAFGYDVTTTTNIMRWYYAKFSTTYGNQYLFIRGIYLCLAHIEVSLTCTVSEAIYLAPFYHENW